MTSQFWCDRRAFLSRTLPLAKQQHTVKVSNNVKFLEQLRVTLSFSRSFVYDEAFKLLVAMASFDFVYSFNLAYGVVHGS